MKPNLLKQTLFYFITTFVISGCATIVGKSSYPVAIRTDPKGANISITDKKGNEVYKGRSPATVTLKSGAGYFSKAEYKVTISARGYSEHITTLNYKLNGWYFGNLLLGGLIGMLIIDPATGAMWKLDSPPIDVTLTRSEAISSATLKIIDIKDVPENIKGSLVRLK